LKHTLTYTLALVRIIYTNKAKEVILRVDTSLKG